MPLRDYITGAQNKILIGGVGVGLIISAVTYLSYVRPAFQIEQPDGDVVFTLSDHGAIGVQSGSGVSFGSLSDCLKSGGSSGATMTFGTCGSGGGGSVNTGAILNAANDRFVNVSGDTMTGSLVIQNGTSHTSTTTALLRVRGTMSGYNVFTNGTLSGANLRATGSAYSYVTGNLGIGTTLPKAKLDVLGTISGSSLRISSGISASGGVIAHGTIALRSLTSCASLQTSSTGVVSCGSGGSGSFGSGNVITIGNQRYVSKQGDTMTGALVIQNGNTHSATTNALLQVRGTMSGYYLNVYGNASLNSGAILKGYIPGIFEGGAGLIAQRTGTSKQGKLLFNTSNNQIDFIPNSTDGPTQGLSVYSRLNLFGTNDVFFQAQPESAGYTAFESYNSLGLILSAVSFGAGGGIKFAPQRTVRAEFSRDGELAIGQNLTDPGANLVVSGATIISDRGNVLQSRLAKATLDVIGTISGSLITQNGAGNNYFMGNFGLGKIAPSTKLDVIGTMSGSRLVVSGNSMMSGALVVKGNITTKGNLSGATLNVTSLKNCNLDTDANGLVTCGTDAAGGGGSGVNLKVNTFASTDLTVTDSSTWVPITAHSGSVTVNAGDVIDINFTVAEFERLSGVQSPLINFKVGNGFVTNNAKGVAAFRQQGATDFWSNGGTKRFSLVSQTGGTLTVQAMFDADGGGNWSAEAPSFLQVFVIKR